MSKYRNIKIHVPTPEISEKVQKKLFEDGCYWEGCGQGHPKYTDYQYLYILRCGCIESGEFKAVFIDASDQEVPYQSILDRFHDVKIAWANGEVVQRLTEAGHGEKWVDWRCNSYLDIESGYDWRVKPKTKTIKQWEYKKTIFEGEEVYTVAFRNKALAMESYRDCGAAITEPTLVEYEVPNE